VTLLGPVKSVTAFGKTNIPDRRIVGERSYTEWLKEAASPEGLNYWDVVTTAETDTDIKMEVEDNLFAIYEMANGAVGCYHFNWVTYHPTLPQLASDSRNLKVYGTDGNLILGSGHFASIISRHTDLLPAVDEMGWYHMEDPYGPPPAGSTLPKPRGFNYYEESTAHLIDCILNDKEPIPGPEWGLHITEMMWGAVVSSRTGRRYQMTTTLAV
jgi:predicted dehydrogenase